MQVKMKRDATCAVNPAVATSIEDFKDGQIVGDEYPEQFKADLLNTDYAELVKEKKAAPADKPAAKKPAAKKTEKGKAK